MCKFLFTHCYKNHSLTSHTPVFQSGVGLNAPQAIYWYPPLMKAKKGVNCLNKQSFSLKTERKSEVLVFFDDDCGICKASIQWLLRVGSREQIEFLPNGKIQQIFNEAENVSELIEKSYKQMVAVDRQREKVYLGYDCFVLILSLSSSFKRRSIAMAMKPYLIRVVGKLVYKTVARNRRFLSGKGASCGL